MLSNWIEQSRYEHFITLSLFTHEIVVSLWCRIIRSTHSHYIDVCGILMWVHFISLTIPFYSNVLNCIQVIFMIKLSYFYKNISKHYIECHFYFSRHQIIFLINSSRCLCYVMWTIIPLSLSMLTIKLN